MKKVVEIDDETHMGVGCPDVNLGNTFMNLLMYAWKTSATGAGCTTGQANEHLRAPLH